MANEPERIETTIYESEYTKITAIKHYGEVFSIRGKQSMVSGLVFVTPEEIRTIYEWMEKSND
jgi:hypothetical protein